MPLKKERSLQSTSAVDFIVKIYFLATVNLVVEIN